MLPRCGHGKFVHASGVDRIDAAFLNFSFIIQPFTQNAYYLGSQNDKVAVLFAKSQFCPMNCNELDLYRVGWELVAIECKAEAK